MKIKRRNNEGKVKRRNNEGKHKERISDLERVKKQLSLILKQFESGHYEDLEEAYDMIEDMQNLESIIEANSYQVVL